MAPTIYTLTNDDHAAHFGLTPKERDYLLTRCYPNRWHNGVQGRIETLVAHIQAGTTRGSLDWWVNGRDQYGNRISASSNITTQQDGSILEVIDKKHAPWTNGDVDHPRPDAAELIARPGNKNLWSWTCEAEILTPSTAFTPQHWEAVCWAFDDQLKKNPHLDPAVDILGHKSINSVNRPYCGLYVDKLKAELMGDHRPGKPTDAKAFGTVTKYATPIMVKVNATAGLNVRPWAETNDTYSPVIDYLPFGAVFTAVAHVIGETVAGINEWYIDASGRRMWSGGTNRPGMI